MDAASILLVFATLGVNVGWTPLNESPVGYERIAPIDRELAAESHTVYFAGQPGWGPDRYENPPPAAAPNYDRYPVAPSSTASGVGPPPGVADRARTAINETGTTLRDGVEAGIRAANQELSQGGEQLFDATRGAAQELSQQLQGWTDSAGQEFQSTGHNAGSALGPVPGGGSRQQVSNPFGAVSAQQPATSKTRGGAAPPPWSGSSALTEPDWPTEPTDSPASINRAATQQTASTPTESGWSSVGSNLAPPPLIVPQLVNATENTAPPRSAAGDSGPGFPAAASGREPMASVRAETAADSWAIGWGTDASAQPATIGRSSTNSSPDATIRDRDLATVQPLATRPQDSPQTSVPSGDLWENDPWAEPPQTSPAGAPAQQQGATAPAQVASTPNGQPPVGAAAIHGTVSATSPSVVPPVSAGPAAPNSAAQAPAADEPPWMPLLVVSLSLAGSLGANLFLGWSYMDARQKYRSLVRKTADKFRRATAAAA